MNKRAGYLAAAGLVLIGCLLLWIGTLRSVIVLVNGEARQIQTRALNVQAALQEAGLFVTTADRLEPPVQSWLGWNPIIYLETASAVYLWTPAQGALQPFYSSERIPANLLLQANLRLYPNDLVFWNGEIISSNQPLPVEPAYSLQVKPAAQVTLLENGQEHRFSTSASSLGEALWQSKRSITTADRLSLPVDALLGQDVSVTLKKARPLQILVDGRTLSNQTTAATVGAALAESDLSLQGLDYSIPADGESLPVDGKVRIVRVREEILLSQTTTPFKSEYQPDPTVELDQRRIVEAGQLGVEITRTRVRYEDRKEVNRTTEEKWTASQPKNQVIGYGTKVVVRTLQAAGGNLEYWRAVQIYATSYSPCNSAADRCYPYTSSGKPVQRGVVAVTLQWYRQMAGQQVYVPGYGSAVIADVGGGISGRYWIDLGFSDADYESWHQTVTVYFLTPLPAVIPWILP